jgi:class 3 adenylate cyclase
LAREQRRLAVILAADLVGFSRLMGRDESGTLARLKEHRSALIDPKIAEHRRRSVKTTGDGMLLPGKSKMFDFAAHRRPRVYGAITAPTDVIPPLPAAGRSR